jgi:inorganic phosphate transporter, PiT family
VREISAQFTQYGNDMYLASEAIRFLMKDDASTLSQSEIKTLNTYKLELDRATTFRC